MAYKLLRTSERAINIAPSDWSAVYEVTETYSCLPADVSGLRTYVKARTPDGFTGRSAPKFKYDQHDVGFFIKETDSRKDRFVAVYKTPTNEELMLSTYNVAILQGRSATRHEQALVDLDGNTVQGFDKDEDSGQAKWVIESGGRFVIKPLEAIRIHALVSDTNNFGNFMPYVGCINSTTMSYVSFLGGQTGGIGELLLTGISFTPYNYNKFLYFVDYDFLWVGNSGLTWNDILKTRLYDVKIREELQYNVDGAVIKNSENKPVYKKVRKMIPTDDVRTGRMFESHDFSFIDSMLGW